MSAGAPLRSAPLDPQANEHADCCWQYFQTVGSLAQVRAALQRLREHGWRVLSEPEAAPFDTWTVRVRHPRRCLHVG